MANTTLDFGNPVNFEEKVVFLNGVPLTLPVASSDPVGTSPGDLYFNTTSATVKYYDGSVWQDIAVGNASLVGQTLAKSSIIVGDISNLSAAVDTASQGNITADSTGLNINANVITDTMVATGAGIEYSKLDLTSSIVDSDISTAAAIEYSKLNLANSVQASDMNSGAATSTQVLVANGAGSATYRALTTSDLPGSYLPLSGGTMTGAIDIGNLVINANGSLSTSDNNNYIDINDGSGNVAIGAGDGQILFNTDVAGFTVVSGQNINLNSGTLLNGNVLLNGYQLYVSSGNDLNINATGLDGGSVNIGAQSGDINIVTGGYSTVTSNLININAVSNNATPAEITIDANGGSSPGSVVIGANTATVIIDNLQDPVSVQQPTTMHWVEANTTPAAMTTAGDMIYEDATPTPVRLPIGSSGQVLTVTGGLPSWQNAAAAGVTSVAFADTSATPIYAVSGSPITGAGTIDIALETQSAAKVLAGPISGSAAEPTFRSLAATDIPSLPYISNTLMTAAGDIIYENATPIPARLPIGTDGQILTVASGLPAWGTVPATGVTSVAIADTSTIPIYTVSGSPITGAGTLDLTLNTQTANTVFAGPSTGTATEPTFRSLVAADIPSLSGTYLPLNGGTMTGTLVSGSLYIYSNGHLSTEDGNNVIATDDGSGNIYIQALDGAVNVATNMNVEGPLVAQNTLNVQGALETEAAIVATGYQLDEPTSGGTVNIGNAVSQELINPAGTLATLTINLPTSPVDGQQIGIATSQQLTAVTMSGGSNIVAGAITQLYAGGYAKYMYNTANTIWFRIG